MYSLQLSSLTYLSKFSFLSYRIKTLFSVSQSKTFNSPQNISTADIFIVFSSLESENLALVSRINIPSWVLFKFWQTILAEVTFQWLWRLGHDPRSTKRPIPLGCMSCFYALRMQVGSSLLLTQSSPHVHCYRRS